MSTKRIPIIVTYQLDEDGRKASLRQGGDGRLYQQIEGDVTGDDLDVCDVNNDGEVSLSLGALKAPIKDVAEAIKLAREKKKPR